MKRNSLRMGLSAFGGISALLVVVMGCQTNAVVQCTYGGKIYSAGDSFRSDDGCNTCSCGSDGAVACTLMGCIGPQCTYGGKTYFPGQTFPSSDGCNTCTCGNGAVACTERYCYDGGQDASDAGGTCSYAGKSYSDGDTFPSTDGCNTCFCNSGVVGCTKRACLDSGSTDGDAGYTCPPDGTINCMPIVPAELVPLCSGPQHDFIVTSCPRVRFVY